MRKVLFLLLPALFTGFFHASGQGTIKDSSLRTFMVGVAIGGQLPGGDMAKRFGSNITAGGFFTYKSKTNWLFTLEYAYIYGSSIKEAGILDSVSTKDASRSLIAGDGTFQIMDAYESGNMGFLKIGKILPFLQHNPNSGLTVRAGVGFMEHKIFYYYAGDPPPQIAGDYVKGYDRLTFGYALVQELGYHYQGNNARINFTIDFQVIEGFTKGMRAYDFDLMRQDRTQRTDILYGLKLGWFFPLYGKRSHVTEYRY